MSLDCEKRVLDFVREYDQIHDVDETWGWSFPQDFLSLENLGTSQLKDRIKKEIEQVQVNALSRELFLRGA